MCIHVVGGDQHRWGTGWHTDGGWQGSKPAWASNSEAAPSLTEAAPSPSPPGVFNELQALRLQERGHRPAREGDGKCDLRRRGSGQSSGVHAGGWLCECHPGLRGRGAVSVVHGR